MDIIAIILNSLSGFIAAIALVTTIHYTRIQINHSQRQTKALEEQVEELRKQTKESMKRPKIELEKDLETLDKSFPVNSVNLNNLTIVPVGQVKFIRIMAKNTGDTTAKECVAKAYIERAPELGGVLLHWVRYHESIFPSIPDQYRSVDIAKEDSEIADVIVLGNNGEVFIRSIRSPNLLGRGNDTRLRLQKGDKIRVSVSAAIRNHQMS